MNTPYIVTPPDNTRILRYLDVFKFIDLLTTHELFLCRLDKLDDPREGRLPQSVLDKDPLVKQEAERFAAVVRDCVCVNCWHFGEKEDLRMWDEYADCGAGLAIRSTIGMLKGALQAASGQQHIGEVTYLDHQHADSTLNGRDLAAAICVKDDSFRHECEVRVIMETEDDGTPGTRVAVQLELLIDEVLIGPRAPSVARASIEQLMKDYNVVRPVLLSQILTIG